MNRNYHPNIVQIDSPSNQSKQMLVLQSNLYGNYYMMPGMMLRLSSMDRINRCFHQPTSMGTDIEPGNRWLLHHISVKPNQTIMWNANNPTEFKSLTVGSRLGPIRNNPIGNAAGRFLLIVNIRLSICYEREKWWVEIDSIIVCLKRTSDWLLPS